MSTIPEETTITPTPETPVSPAPPPIETPVVAPSLTPANVPPVVPAPESASAKAPVDVPAAPPPNPLPSEYPSGILGTGPGQTLNTGGGTDVRSLLAKAMAKIQFKKTAKLEKLMVLAKERGQITNDDAQKLLRVSDATATRYLGALVKAGRLKRVGNPSHSSYQPIP